MKNIILDRIALWRPKATDAFAAVKQPKGLPIFNPSAKIFTAAEAPIYRFAKNYSVGKGKNATKFCLFVRTYSEDYEHVEKQLDATAKTITAQRAREVCARGEYDSFDYLDNTLEVR